MIFKMSNFFQRTLQVYSYMRKLLASNPNLGGVILAWSTTEFRIYITIIIKTKVVLAIHSRVCSASIEITAILVITINMERINSFFVPCLRCAIHTLISPYVHIFVRSTDINHRGYVSDEIKIFKRGSRVICIYDAICVVSAGSSPVSRVISKPKEVRSFDEVGLPIWGVTADGWVVLVKHDVFLKTESTESEGRVMVVDRPKRNFIWEHLAGKSRKLIKKATTICPISVQITRKILHPLYVSLIRINRRDTPSDKDVLRKLPGEVLRQTTWWDQVQSKLVLWIRITEHLEISTVVIDNCVLSKQVRLIAM